MTTSVMSPLQQREDTQLRGLSARTQQAYARAVWQLAQYYHRRPDQLSDEELRQYFLYLTNEKKIARPTATIALCGIKFFYEQTLKQAWPTLRFVRSPSEWKLPVVLSRKEVRQILDAARIPLYRACLTTIYACGLRLLEGTRLQVADVDSARMLLHIHGKGKQDRYVPLPEPTLQLLLILPLSLQHRNRCPLSRQRQHRPPLAAHLGQLLEIRVLLPQPKGPRDPEAATHRPHCQFFCAGGRPPLSGCLLFLCLQLLFCL